MPLSLEVEVSDASIQSRLVVARVKLPCLRNRSHHALLSAADVEETTDLQVTIQKAPVYT